MTSGSGDRSAHFPAIEKKHGKPVTFWLKELKSLGEAKYADQISFLRERHGFSQAHANALEIKVPLDWKVDKKLLHALVRARLAEIKSS